MESTNPHRTLKIVLCTLVPVKENEPLEAVKHHLLDEKERERAARFAFARDRWSYTAAHALLRTMLAEFHGLAARDWRFRYNTHGRPETEGPAAIPFNISHTHGMAACAIAADDWPAGVDIGIDAETTQRSVHSLALAQRYFSPPENEWLRAQPAKQRDSEFIRLWTLKEAVSKAVGLGIGLDFSSFYCSIAPPSVSFDIPDWGPDQAWVLENWSIAPCHSVSLAVRRPPGVVIDLEVRHMRGISCLYPPAKSVDEPDLY